mmetsp:Transcript_34107/g.77881  ORF Transcript_34107/g.77881 Transcript_34107/m.77881 type:complete len:205 (-) Transcript_34107:130-744(-)
MFLPGERSFDAFQQFRNRRAPRKRSFHQYNVPCRTHSSRNKRFRVDLERRSALVFCSSNAVVVLPVMICDMQYSSTSSRDALFALNNPRGGSCAMDDDDTVVRRARRVDFHVPGPRSAFPHCCQVFIKICFHEFSKLVAVVFKAVTDKPAVLRMLALVTLDLICKSSEKTSSIWFHVFDIKIVFCQLEFQSVIVGFLATGPWAA